MTCKTIIADDEQLARKRLRRMLSNCAPDIEVVAEAGDGESAARIIEELKPDLVFLDIQMPGQSGIEVALKTNHKPGVIFITAFSNYAIDAFKASAVDYLLKPVEEPELRRAIEKFKSRFHPDRDYEKLLRSLSDKFGGDSCHKVAISTGSSIKLLAPEDIICLEADNKYTTVFTRKGELLTDTSLTGFEQILPVDRFIRIHRKYIVNLAYIEEITRCFNYRYKIKLTVPTKIDLVVGRKYIEKIRAIVGPVQ